MQGFPGVQAQAPPHAPGPVAGGSAPPPGPDPASAPEATYAELLEKAHRLASAAAAEDNKRACQPHVNVPFADLDDAIARLLPYHVFTAGDEDEADLGVVPARFGTRKTTRPPSRRISAGGNRRAERERVGTRSPRGRAGRRGAPATTAGADLKRDGASEKAPERAPEKAPEANPRNRLPRVRVRARASGGESRSPRDRARRRGRSRAWSSCARSRASSSRSASGSRRNAGVETLSRPSANAEPSSEPSSGPSPSALTAAEAYLVAAKVSEEARRRDAADRLGAAEAERERKQRAEAERARAQAEARARAEQAARESAARAAATRQRSGWPRRWPRESGSWRRSVNRWQRSIRRRGVRAGGRGWGQGRPERRR